MPAKITFKLKPIRSRGNLGDKVYRQIKAAIIQGAFTPGALLQEEHLTKAMTISRTPLREALSRLKAEGLVEMMPHKGARVAEFSQEEWDQLFQAREAIETVFFDLSVRNLTQAEIKALYSSHLQAKEDLRLAQGDEKKEAEAMKAYFEVDWAFHDAMVKATRNKYWIATFNNIRERIQICSYQVGKLPLRFDMSVQEHEAILQALVGNRMAEAKKQLRKHIRSARVSLSLALGENDS